MIFIVLYGPPAIGKLTIAEKLAAKTGYKIFQNNPTVHAVLPLFEFGTPEFIRTLHNIRIMMLDEAARSNIAGLIFTVCYDPNEDESAMSEMIDVVERSGGKVHLVQLTCPESVLFARIGNESRKPHGKLMSNERLREMLNRYDLFKPYRLRDGLTIDTSTSTVEQSVESILASFGIQSND
jgi:shikimate kinase